MKCHLDQRQRVRPHPTRRQSTMSRERRTRCSSPPRRRIKPLSPRQTRQPIQSRGPTRMKYWASDQMYNMMTSREAAIVSCKSTIPTRLAGKVTSLLVVSTKLTNKSCVPYTRRLGRHARYQMECSVRGTMRVADISSAVQPSTVDVAVVERIGALNTPSWKKEE